MPGNSFGTIFKITSFGESHGKCVGGVIEGVIPNLEIDMEFIQNELNRRSSGQTDFASTRKESDKIDFLSGIFEGKSTGAPIAFLIWNNNQIPEDYDNIKNIFRPSHADYTCFAKYGIYDHRGGGRSSARETAVRVVAGAIAKLALKKLNISIVAYTSGIGEIKLNKKYFELDLTLAGNNTVRCPDMKVADEMILYINKIKEENDSIGGIVTCVIKNVPAGIGEPVFDKLNAMLAHSMFSINAVKGFEIGSGFDSVKMKGSEHNDEFYSDSGKIRTKTNNSGGIQGGISNGEDIYFNVAFKPVSSINKTQETIDTEGNRVNIKIEGRHDICIVPRAIPVVEAMAAITIMDAVLINK